MISTTVRRLAAFLAVCVLAVLPATAGSASAAASTPAARPSAAPHGRTTFGIQPSGAKKPDQRPNLSYSVTPGAALRDHIAVWNYGTKPITLRLYGGDAFITADGGFDVLAAGKKSTAVGSWVKLGKGKVTVPRRSRVIVPLTLTVPRSATPGDHAGGIVASLSATRTDAKGNKVRVDQRVGARIYLRVSGKLTPRLAVDGPHTDYHGTLNPFGTGSATVTYTVRNTGNVRLGARQVLRVSDLFGGGATVRGPRDIAELLPGSALTFTASATGVLPTVRDTATVTVDPVPVRGDVPPPVRPRVTAAAGFWAVPWTVLGLVLILLTAVTVNLVRRRRRRRGAGAANRRPAPAGPSRAPAGRATAMTAGLVAAAMVLVGAPSARAADAGQLTVSPAHGSDTQPITLTASAPCPTGTSNVIARVAGAGFPRGGQIVVGNAPVATYPKAPGGGSSIPLIYTMRDYATTAGFHTLRGTYTFTLTCLKGAFSRTGLGDFTGSLRFASGKAYRDGTKAEVSAAAGASSQPSASGGQGGPGASAAPGGAASGSGGAAPATPPNGSGAPNGAAGLTKTVAEAPVQHSNTMLIAFSSVGFVVAFLALLVGAVFWMRGRRARTVQSASGD
ncbi:DUF916 domain-containing protein [Streptomyces olivochromogenes]|uniref:DUF916 domain-containing protein n=1 Tax=Streptomyces olivochromogenes TaxID=1963 RepID=UPI001F34DD12|nr:DUF916 domain-containing protein [Streptomyces olivochromogenes]MCF3133793.1 hypothetical protein [Streptomyces olivochromogenes]